MDWKGLASEAGPYLGNLFSQGAGMLGSDNWQNPSNFGMPYIQQIPGMARQTLNPYIKAGQQAVPGLQNQFSKLLQNPGGRVNEIGKGYQQSPGLQFAIKQALAAAGHGAAAGGYAGSPQHEFYNMQQATGLANQDYNSWMQNALGEYNQGLAGQQNLYGTGANASNSLAQMISQALAGQGSLAYGAQAMQNEHEANQQKERGSFFDTLGGLASTALPFLF
jgi:hypothetical protein